MFLSFFCFFFLAWIGSASGSASCFAAITSKSPLWFFRALLVWLLVVFLTGAEPILDGGGELARENEVDVMDALSEIASLVGVPGRSCLDADTRLACLDAGNVGAKVDVVDDGVATLGAGVSDFLFGGILKVLGFRAKGDCTVVPVGVLAGAKGGYSEDDAASTAGLFADSVAALVLLAFVSVAMLKTPVRFSAFDVALLDVLAFVVVAFLLEARTELFVVA